jgi:hypothetical protein
MAAIGTPVGYFPGDVEHPSCFKNAKLPSRNGIAKFLDLGQHAAASTMSTAART